MNTASVGFHCPECVKSNRQQVHTAGSMFGSRPIVTQVLLAINVAVFSGGLIKYGVHPRSLSGLLGVFTMPFLHADIGHLALPDRYALLVPGSARHRPDKRWPAENYAALAGHLKAPNPQPFHISQPRRRKLAWHSDQSGRSCR